jgi:RNA polymerase sigma factor (sigma-70 family)
MATSQISGVIKHIRRTVLPREGAGLSDGQLLEGYISRRDETAFAALARRHGPMVWGVCRRVLRNHHAAEDAFQATFLVLVRRAASIASRELLANWLYGVAHQTALKARATAAKRKERERQVAEMPEQAVTQQDPWRDLQPVLDEELSRLPDKYRGVIILCDLEGKTRKEAAVQLACPEGTVASRLVRARIMLAKRLTQRGVALSGGALAAVLSQQAVSAGVPNSVVVSTIKAASLLAAGKAAATGAISVKVAALTEGVMKAMLFTKLKTAVAVVLVLGCVTTATTILTCRTAVGQEKKPPAASDKPPIAGERVNVPPKQELERDVKEEEKKLQGTWRLVCGFYGKYRPVPGVSSGENIKNTSITIAGKEWIGSTPEGKKQQVGFRVDASEILDIKDQGFASGLGAFGLQADTVKSPKRIDIQDIGGVYVPGIYGLHGDDLVIRLSSGGKQGRPTQFAMTSEGGVLLMYKRIEPEKGGVIAWGKEVGGLQAGLGFYPAEKRSYRHGEKVRLVVRVRNVGKEEVQFKYLRQFLMGTSPAVTDGDGRPVSFDSGITAYRRPQPQKVDLAPGKEIEIYELTLVLEPASESNKNGFSTLYGAGKFRVQYERLVPADLDPNLSKLTTGKLELEVKDAEKLPEKKP